jgi:hypothetical protein
MARGNEDSMAVFQALDSGKTQKKHRERPRDEEISAMVPTRSLSGKLPT